MTTKKTPFYEEHLAAGARFVNFAGWEMPIQYTGIIAEHHAVREDLGLFDVSHMGEVEVIGVGALQAVNRLITNDLERLEDGRACYTPLCLPSGGVIDDLIVYRFSTERILICTNAANHQRDYQHFVDEIDDESLEVLDRIDDYAQLALQGPRAPAFLDPLCDADLESLGRFAFIESEIAGVRCIVSRTGYTGEEGYELYIPSEGANAVWASLMGAAAPPRLIGLGARDTLRMEMKYPLYGQELSEETTPLEALLAWTVKLKKNDFIGRAALLAQKETGIPRSLVAFVMEGRAIPRNGYPILTEEGEEIGAVTSGTRSPTLSRGIGLGYIPRSLAKVGAPIWVSIRGKLAEGVQVKVPRDWEG